MKVAFLDQVHPILTESFEKIGWEVDMLDNLSRTEILEKINRYQGIILRSRIKMNAEFLSHASNLKFIGRPGAGLENIDLGYCSTNEIEVFRSPEGNRDAVAEHAIGMLLSLFNNLKRADSEVRDGLWIREGNRGHELKGKTVGIIGYGYMGKAIAERLAGFGVRIIAYDKYISGFASASVEEVSLDVLQKEADVVSLHIPHSDETSGMVNSSFINAFAKSIYLINTARGSSVKISDLMEAIQTGKVLGACLDVLEIESSTFEEIAINFPPEFQGLISSGQVVLSPHIAGWTHEAKLKMGEFLAEKIIAKFGPGS
ncbi:MAG: D-3-phosphoglycerate dehydrogenase [Parvicellaceae bacterium]|jgi:D-3-phosphoglycerate dehydrogenase